MNPPSDTAGGERLHRHLTPSDWNRIAADAEFRSLLSSKRRFIVPAVIFFLAYYFALPLLVGFAPNFMRRPAFGHVNLAYAFALSQFAMAWIVLILYLMKSRRFDLLEAQIVRRMRARFRA